MPAVSRRGGFAVVTGLEQLRRNVELSEQIFDQALDAGEDAAAAVYKLALEQAAPHGESGDLAKSIIVYERRDRKALFKAASRRSLLVGPSKRGFYGFFLEFGTSKMAARPWARSACDAATPEAQAAGRAAYEAYVRQHMSRLRK